MLFRTLITIAFISPYTVFCGENIAKEIRPDAVFPVPFELPNRNDRSDQCWLRVEDAEVTETVTVYCYIAQAFLRNYIHDYNSNKMTEDDVDVSLWSEDPRPQDDNMLTKSVSQKNNILDWKLTTVMDPTTRMRLYVTKQAVCRLIMYSRDGMTNYKVDCDKILYYVNNRMNDASTIQQVPKMCVITSIAFLVLGP
ncbi:uncharacterized protein [Epargyreus clarus]|uniref:uncharacterized protein n=1 Tax=Epargyreus clarus TaxID=520877 RepID=UPI003C2E9258